MHAALDCEDCKKYVYDIETCKPQRRGGKIAERPKGVPTPCQKCPKKSPEQWQKIKPNRRTIATLNLYKQVRATAGRCLTAEELGDALLTANLAALDEVYRNHESAQQMRTVSDLVTSLRRAYARG